jgi:hypothetical protein
LVGGELGVDLGHPFPRTQLLGMSEHSARDLVQADIVVLGQPMSPAPNAITSMPIAIGESEYMQALADEHPLGW